MPSSKSQRFNIFLLKEGVDDAAAALSSKHQIGESVDEHRAKVGDSEGTLYLKRPYPRKPGWLKYLTDESIVKADEIGEPKNASTSAVLIFNVDDRLVALTFGYGRFLLDPEAYEDDFGLKVVLSSVEPTALTSIDAKTFEELTLHSRKQVSKAAPVSSFDIDIERDIVRAVAGRPRDENLGTSISGADSLLVSAKASAGDIVPLCRSAIDVYERGELPDEFRWVDNIKRVKTPEVIERLDAALIGLLNSQAWDNIHLAAPEVLDPAIEKHFRFDRKPDEPMDDPSISRYMEIATRGGKISLGQLRSHQLEVINEQDDNLLEHWKVYRCVVADLELDDSRFTLSGGQWYEVNKNYRDEVIESIGRIQPTTFDFPDCGADDTEGEFNSSVAAVTDAECLDGKFITITGPNKFELCDLMRVDNGDVAFFHVKKRGSSSTLSHLFNQGVNSAEMLIGDRGFREKAIELVTRNKPEWSDVLSPEGVDPTSTEICFTVITRGRNGLPLTLPFFSLVSLKNAATRLRTRGFNVTVAEVPQKIATAEAA